MKYIKKANKRGDGHQHIELMCPICNKKFTTRLTYYNFHKNRGQKAFHCSTKCVHVSQHTIPALYCKECGKEINNIYGQRNRKFCCRTCYDKWQNNKEKRECLWCGNPFLTWNNSKQRYCCKRCALASTGETSIEKIMREALETRNIKFKQYEKVGAFFVDFKLENKVIIECDGIHWHTMPEVIERDRRKNELLKQEGYKLFRFTDKEINKNVNACIDSVLSK